MILKPGYQRRLDQKMFESKVFADAAIGDLACIWQGRTKFMLDMFFEIQSVGKILTSIAILKLVEDGILYIDQPVREWINEFIQKDF